MKGKKFKRNENNSSPRRRRCLSNAFFFAVCRVVSTNVVCFDLFFCRNVQFNCWIISTFRYPSKMPITATLRFKLQIEFVLNIVSFSFFISWLRKLPVSMELSGSAIQMDFDRSNNSNDKDNLLFCTSSLLFIFIQILFSHYVFNKRNKEKK